MPGTETLIELCAKDAVGEGEVLRVDHGDYELAVYQVDGEFYVTDNNCTHGPGELSEGYLEGYVIECDFHQGQFDIRDGRVVGPPCMIDIRTYKVIPHPTAVVIDPDA